MKQLLIRLTLLISWSCSVQLKAHAENTDTIFVSDPTDPALAAYKDSSELYEFTLRCNTYVSRRQAAAAKMLGYEFFSEDVPLRGNYSSIGYYFRQARMRPAGWKVFGRVEKDSSGKADETRKKEILSYGLLHKTINRIITTEGGPLGYLMVTQHEASTFSDSLIGFNLPGLRVMSWDIETDALAHLFTAAPSYSELLWAARDFSGKNTGEIDDPSLFAVKVMNKMEDYKRSGLIVFENFIIMDRGRKLEICSYARSSGELVPQYAKPVQPVKYKIIEEARPVRDTVLKNSVGIVTAAAQMPGTGGSVKKTQRITVAHIIPKMEIAGYADIYRVPFCDHGLTYNELIRAFPSFKYPAVFEGSFHKKPPLETIVSK